MSITRLALRQQLGEQETGLATLGIATANGTTTTVIDATRLAGAYSASRWSRGTAIRFSTLNSAAAATNTSLDSYAPATGTVTVLPAITATKSADVFEIWDAVKTVDEVDQAINKGLTKHCFLGWIPVPLTKVPDGDCGESAVTGLWTASAAGITPSKVDVASPDKIGRRYLRTLHTIATKYVYSNTMNAVAGDVWRLSAVCKPAVGTAVLSAYDVTNSADITLSGDGGSYAGRAPKHLDNTFTIPATCKQIRIHLGGTGATDDIYWTSIIAYEQDERQFVLPRRIAKKRVGDMLYRSGNDYEDFHWTPYCESGRHAGLLGGMGGVIVQLSHAPGTGDTPYVEELCTYDALSADTGTTECDTELALACCKYELLKGLANKGYALPTPQGYLAPSEWRQKRDEALREMQSKQASLGAQSKTVFR